MESPGDKSPKKTSARIVRGLTPARRGPAPELGQSKPQLVRSVRQMQTLAIRWRRAGTRIGFVPTMGYLHEGHLSLVKAARRVVGSKGRVVVSIYVNPTQFGPTEDLSRYPRDFARDARLCSAAGVDVIFCPGDGQMYPGSSDGKYSTYVVETLLSQELEAKTRPTHFRGVATIVAKLFNCVMPDVAVFGAKDWQQAAVIRRMSKDLNFPLRILVEATLRERDGLAMSSRNSYLNPEERLQAPVLYRALMEARRTVRCSVRAVSAGRLKEELKGLIQSQPFARLDYLEFIDPTTLEPRRIIGKGTQAVLAVYIGATRLIDNMRL